MFFYALLSVRVILFIILPFCFEMKLITKRLENSLPSILRFIKRKVL